MNTRGVPPKKSIHSSKRVLCTCTECKAHLGIDPSSGLQKIGRFVGRLEYKNHRQLDLNRHVLETTIFDLSDPLPLESQPKPSTPHPRSRPSRTSTSIPTKIKEVQSAFAERSIQHLDVVGLIFSQPPNYLSPPLPVRPDGYELKQDARANSLLLEYFDWLLKQRKLLKRMALKTPFGEDKLRIVVLQTEVTKQLDELQVATEQEWARQRQAAVLAVTTGGDIVDTGMSLF